MTNNLKLHFLDVEAFDDGEFFTGIISAFIDDKGNIIKNEYIKLNNKETINYLRALRENDIVIAYNDRYDYNAIRLSAIEGYSNKEINDVLIRTKNEDIQKQYKYTSGALNGIGGYFKTYDVLSLCAQIGKLKVIARQNGFVFNSSASVNVEEYNIEDIEATLYLFDKLGGLDEIKAYLYLLDEYKLQSIRCLNNNLIVSQIMKQLRIDKESITERVPNYNDFFNNFLDSINHPVTLARKSIHTSVSHKTIYLNIGKYNIEINQGGLHSPSGTILNNKKYQDVILADFASLYPTCYTSKYMPAEVIPEKTKSILNDLIKERISIKKSDPIKAHAFKIILNTIYGQLKTTTESLTPLVTVLSQMALIDLMQGLYNIDNDILFIDYNTDGIYFTSEKREECILFCKNHQSYWTNPEVSKVEVELADILYYKDTNNYVFLDNKKVTKIKGAWVYNKGFSYTVGRDTQNKEITFEEVYKCFDNLGLSKDEIKTLYAPKIYNFKDIIIAGLEGKTLPPAKLMAGYKTEISAEYFDVDLYNDNLDLIDETDTIKISTLKQKGYQGIFKPNKTTNDNIGTEISFTVFAQWLGLIDKELNLNSVYVIADNKINPKRQSNGYDYYNYKEALESIKNKSNNKKLIKLHLSAIKGIYVYDLDFKYLVNKDKLKDKELIKKIREYPNNFNHLENFVNKLGIDDYCIEYNALKDMIDNKNKLIKKNLRLGCHIYLNRELTDTELNKLETFIKKHFYKFHQIENKTNSSFITLYQSISKNSLPISEFINKYAKFDIKEKINTNLELTDKHIQILNGYFTEERIKVIGDHYCIDCKNAEHTNNPLSLKITFDKLYNKYVGNCFVCNESERKNTGNRDLLNRLNNNFLTNGITIKNNNNKNYLDDRGTGSGKSYDMAEKMFDLYEQNGQIIAIFNTKDNITGFIDILKNVNVDKYYNMYNDIYIITADTLEANKTSVFKILTELKPKVIFILNCYFREFIKGIDDKYLLSKDRDNYYNEHSLYKPLKENYNNATIFIDEADVFINNVLSKYVEIGIFFNSKISYNSRDYKLNIKEVINYIFSKDKYQFIKNEVFYNNKKVIINDYCLNGLINHFKYNDIKFHQQNSILEQDTDQDIDQDISRNNITISIINNIKNYNFFKYSKDDINKGVIPLSNINTPIDILNEYFKNINESIFEKEEIFNFLNKDYKIQPINDSCIGLGMIDNSSYSIYKTNSHCLKFIENWRGDIYLASATPDLVKQIFSNYELTKKAQTNKENKDKDNVIKCRINKLNMGGWQYKKLMETKVNNLHNRLKDLTFNQHLIGLCNILTVRGSKQTAEGQFDKKTITDARTKNNEITLIESTIRKNYGLDFSKFKYMCVTYLRNPSIRGSNLYKDFPLFIYDINTVNTNERFLNVMNVKNITDLQNKQEREDYLENIIEKDREQAYGRMDRGQTNKLAFIFLNDKDRIDYNTKNNKRPLREEIIHLIKEIEKHLNYKLIDKLDFIDQKTWDNIQRYHNIEPQDRPSYAEVYNYFKDIDPDFIKIK